MNHCVSCFYVTLKAEMDRMLKMLHHFHPEITEEIVTPDDFNSFPPLNKRCVYPTIGRDLSKKYKTVTHIDADVLVVDRIDELFDDSSDVRAGRNNSDNNRAAITPGKFLPEVPWTKYVNAGVHSVTGEEFWEDWYNSTVERGLNYEFGEQDILNLLFYSGKYNSILLDPIESNVHLATSFQDGTQTYWDSWKNIVVNNDHLEINGKRIRMLHIAGGSCRKPSVKELFTPRVADFINSIIYV